VRSQYNIKEKDFEYLNVLEFLTKDTIFFTGMFTLIQIGNLFIKFLPLYHIKLISNALSKIYFILIKVIHGLKSS